MYQYVKLKHTSRELVDKDTQLINSESKSIGLINFYIFYCCKNNKFELFLQSLFGIINQEELFDSSYNHYSIKIDDQIKDSQINDSIITI